MQPARASWTAIDAEHCRQLRAVVMAMNVGYELEVKARWPNTAIFHVRTHT